MIKPSDLSAAITRRSRGIGDITEVPSSFFIIEVEDSDSVDDDVIRLIHGSESSHISAKHGPYVHPGTESATSQWIKSRSLYYRGLKRGVAMKLSSAAQPCTMADLANALLYAEDATSSLPSKTGETNLARMNAHLQEQVSKEIAASPALSHLKAHQVSSGTGSQETVDISFLLVTINLLPVPGRTTKPQYGVNNAPSALLTSSTYSDYFAVMRRAISDAIVPIARIVIPQSSHVMYAPYTLVATETHLPDNEDVSPTQFTFEFRKSKEWNGAIVTHVFFPSEEPIDMTIDDYTPSAVLKNCQILSVDARTSLVLKPMEKALSLIPTTATGNVKRVAYANGVKPVDPA